MKTLHWYFPWATALDLYNMTGRGEKLQQQHCYHPFSDSLDMYLTKNHYENYSPKMVPIAKIWGSGSWTTIKTPNISPHGRPMGCLLCGLWRKMTALSRFRAIPFTTLFVVNMPYSSPALTLLCNMISINIRQTLRISLLLFINSITQLEMRPALRKHCCKQILCSANIFLMTAYSTNTYISSIIVMRFFLLCSTFA